MSAEVPWEALHDELRRGLARPGVPPEVVDDLVQEAAERLLRGLPQLRDSARLGPYVGRVVRSVWVDHLRRRRPSGELPDDLEAPPVPVADLAEVVASWLPMMIADLPEAYRTPLVLVELEGQTQAEVARALGLSASGARSRVQRGRRLLRERLEACCDVVREGPRVVDVVARDPCGCDPGRSGP